MATKPTPETAEQSNNVLIVYQGKNESKETAAARTLTKPEVRAARTIQAWRGNDIEINALVSELTAQIANVNKGDLKRPEAMLMAQANTLDELFNNLARRAYNQDSLQVMETLLRLGLKAQTQCRATLETLAAIKNPPIVYAKQANIAAGHQQVNNGVPASCAGEIKNQPNELLTGLPDETLDSGRAGETIPTNQAFAAVE